MAAWLVPNHYPPWTSFHGEACAFAALIAFCAAAGLGKKPLYIDKSLWVFTALVLVIWLQFAGSQISYHGDAALSTLYVVGLGMAWSLGAYCATSQRTLDASLRVLAGLLCAASVISVYVAMLQWLRMEQTLGVFAAERGPDMRPFGNLAQPNHLATLSLMGVVLGSWLYVDGRLRQWQWAALVGYLSFGLVLTESRVGLVAVFVLGTGYLYYSKLCSRMGGWKVVAIWWLALSALGAVWTPLNEALYLQAPREVKVTRDQSRTVMWKQMTAAIVQSPWVGYGWRQTAVAQKTGANTVEGDLPTEYAHNFVLDLLAWVGVPLGGLLLLILAGWFVRAAAKINNADQFFLFASLVPFALHSLTEFPFAYAYFLFPVGWLMGALQTRQAAPPLPAGYRQFGLVWAVAFVVFVAFTGTCVWVAKEYLQAEADYQVMRFQLRGLGKLPEDFSPLNLTLLDQLGEMSVVARMVPYPSMPAVDIERMRRATVTSNWATPHLNYAIALGLNGHPEQAADQLINLRALYGKGSYAQALKIFMEQTQKYPQLSLVKLP